MTNYSDFVFVPATCGASDSGSSSSVGLWMVILHYRSNRGRGSTQSARSHLQRGHRQHVPVSAHRPGKAHYGHTYETSFLSFFSKNLLEFLRTHLNMMGSCVAEAF